MNLLNNQLIIIFYLKSQTPNINIKLNIDESQIGKILDQQNCRFEIADNKEGTGILSVPSFRLLNK